MRLSHVLPVAALLGAVALCAMPHAAFAQEPGGLVAQNWSFEGPFGTINRAAAQRGFQVYKEVCSNCHSMQYGYFRDLSGIGLTAPQIKAIAASVSVSGLDESGQPKDRPALASDHFRSPFPNAIAAGAAMGGAVPPDLSSIILARAGGPDYVYAVLTGYTPPPAGVTVASGTYYNRAFPGHQIHMPQPLHNQQVTYADGKPATIDQEAHDVVTFLAYMAQPEREVRERLGIKVVLFLVLMTGITYAVKRRVWADISH